MYVVLSQIKGWDNRLVEEETSITSMSYLLFGVILLVVTLQVFSWLQFIYLKRKIKHQFSEPPDKKNEPAGLPVAYILKLQQECNTGDIDLLAIWVYDVQFNMFSSLHNNALSADGMSYETGLSLIHPDDKDAYINDIRLLSSGSIEKTTEFLRFYHNGKYEAYLFNAVALKSVLTGHVEKIIGTEENVDNRFIRLYK